MAIEIIFTGDGSHSLMNTEVNETYHSVHGAIQESMHVFIRQGLEFYAGLHPSHEVSVLEVGFGTGLNAMLTLDYAETTGTPVHYCSLEAYPLDAEILLQLNYPMTVKMPDGETRFKMLHSAKWDQPERLSTHFVLEKKHANLEHVILQETVADVIYFDAFAPSRQPALWEISILEKIARTMKPGAVFVTYCAKGQVKRDLRAIGLIVESLPGPPGKKEMVRAIKPG